MIAARLASALANASRFDEARAVAQLAIAALPADNLTRADALLTAGDAARFSFDYLAAIDFYKRAIEAAVAGNDFVLATNARLDLGYAGVTIDPGAVAAELDKALANKAALAKLKKEDLAALEDMRARAAANAGDASGAEHWVQRALGDSGGLTFNKVSLAQIAVRNDAAIIAALRKDDEATRQYMAYTGAGHLKKMDWIGAVGGDLPVCSEETDVRPSDSVVVQFSIADDGHVTGAVPIYASRPGEVGAIFAHAVSRWRWNAQYLQGVDLFWRNALVLELRCVSRPAPIGLQKPVWDSFYAWPAAKGVSPVRIDIVEPNDPRLVLRGPEAIPALLARVQKRGADRDVSAGALQAVLDANGAPPAAYAVMIWTQALPVGGEGPRSFGRKLAANLAATVPAFRSRYPDDPATAWLLLTWALADEDGGDFKSAQPLLQAVLDMPLRTVAPDAPLRNVALLTRL